MTLNIAHRTGIVVSVVCALGIFQNAQATPINHTGSMDGSGTHLYELFGDIGAESVDTQAEVDASVMTNDELWSITATGTSALTMIFEIAGFARVNSFGIYDPNTGDQVTIFEGIDRPGSVMNGATSALTMDVDNNVFINMNYTGSTFTTNTFGYFLQTMNDLVFYSEVDRNHDGEDHMVTFQGNNQDQVQIPGFNVATWTDNEFILAWEDLAAPHWDYDYNDFVVMVESVEPIPLPATLGLFGFGLGLLARRRAQKH